MGYAVTRTGSVSAVARSRARGVKAAVEKGARVAFQSAVERAPEDTGDLKAKIRLLYGVYGGVAALVSDSDHTFPVEFGTHLAHAQPFFRPAVEDGRAAIRKELQGLRGKRA